MFVKYIDIKVSFFSIDILLMVMESSAFTWSPILYINLNTTLVSIDSGDKTREQVKNLDEKWFSVANHKVSVGP